LSYQKESGCFELNNHLAETLGFSSAEDAKKSLEMHFSSHSKISKLDVNLQSSAIMIWFLRHVLVDFRGEWADKYQITSTWISEQVKDKQTEDELLEAARSFVTKRFDVDEEALKEDESFKSTLTIRTEDISVDILKKLEEAGIINETGSIVTDQVIGLLPQNQILISKFLILLVKKSFELVPFLEQLSQIGKKFIMFQFMVLEKKLSSMFWTKIYL